MGFQETLRRLARIDKGFVADRAGRSGVSEPDWT